MKIYRGAIYFLILAIHPTAAQAEDLQTGSYDYRKGTECAAPHLRKVPLRAESPEEQLHPWFMDCQRRISRLLEKEKLRPFSCTFNLDSGGQPCALTIVKTSGSSTLDQSILNAIKSANLSVTEPQYVSLDFVRARGLKLEIVDSPNCRVQMSLGPK
jgi:hypothetical protein